MPMPFAPRVILSHTTQADLHALLRAHSTPQALALRARIVLRAAAPDRPSNLAISREIGCDNHTAGKWRGPSPQSRHRGCSASIHSCAA